MEFISNGGTSTEEYKYVISGDEYGTLPTPTRSNTVTFNVNGGSIVETTNQKTVTYTFEGWYSDKDFKNEVTDTTVVTATKNHELYAKWSGNNTITLPDSTMNNYRLGGWYAESTFLNKVGDAGDSYQVLKDQTLYAKWIREVFQLTLDKNGGTGGTDNIWIKVGYGYFSDADSSNAITKIPSLPTRVGYTFKEYDGLTDEEGNITASNTKYDEEITIQALWDANTYNISYDLNGGIQGTDAPTSGTYDTDVSISNPTKTVTVTGNANSTGATVGSAVSKAQTFAGWTSSTSDGLNTSTAKTGTAANPTTAWSGSAIKNTYFKNLTSTEGATVKLTATWTAVAVTLPTVTKDGGYTCGWNTSSTGTTIEYASGGSYTPSATSAAAITMYAVCKANTATITINKNGSAWSSSGMNVALYSDTTSTYAYSDGTASGSTVTWSGVAAGTYNVYAGKNSGATTTLVDTGVDITVTTGTTAAGTGTATINYYVLTLNKGTGISTVTGAATYLSNQSASISATASSGYKFGSWTVTTGNTPTSTTTASTTVSMSKATTLTAAGTAKILAVTLDKDGGTGGTDGPIYLKYATGWYSDSSATTAITSITVPTKTGYTFEGYYYTTTSGTETTIVDSSGTIKLSNTGFTVAHTITAKWTANTYTIAYTYNGGSKGTNAPTSGTYDTDVSISNPTKTVTVTGNANSTGATVGSATSKAQTFAGWTSSSSAGLSTSTAKHGTAATPTTTWDGTATKNTYFRNLRTGSGTVTLTATWTAVAVTLPTVTKSGYTCGWSTTSTGTTIQYASGGSYTPSATSEAAITMYAVCKANTATITINKDGSAWSSSGMNVALYSGTTSAYAYSAGTASGSTVTWSGVAAGTYNVYAGKNSGATTTLVDTGVDITVTTGTTAAGTGTATINYYVLTLNKGTGISTVTGAATYLSNQTASISATVSTGYTFSKWTVTTGNTPASTTTASTTVSMSKATTLSAGATANTYTITYYLGNGTSTAGVESLGTSTCTYNSTCTLKSFSSDLSGIFPYSSAANTASGQTNYNWSFYGWSTTQTGTTRAYADSASFTYSTAGNISLYAIGSKTFRFYSGIAPTSPLSTPVQYWNPYSTSSTYLTSIAFPSATAITGWTFLGYKGGSSSATSSVTHAASLAGTTSTPAYNVYPYTRSVYKRTLTLSYDANGGSGTVDSQTATQYYNSGYGGNDAISTPTFTLKTNSFTKTGYTFSKWADGSTSGTQYAAEASYTGFSPAVDDTTVTKTMYAIWNINSYTVTYNYSTNGGTSATKTSASVNYNASIDLTPTATKSGWTFVGWNTSSTATTNLSSLTMGTSNVTLYAIFKKDVTITFNKNGATSQTVSGGSASTASTVTQSCTIWNTATSCSITSPSITRSDFTITGYATTSSATTSSWSVSTAKSVSADATWYAITSKTVTITFNKNGADSQTPLNGSASTASTITQSCTIQNSATSCTVTSPTIARAYYTAVGYNTTSTATTSAWTVNTNKSVTANATYYAITRINVVKIYYHPNEGTLTSETSSTSGTTYTWTVSSDGRVMVNNAVLVAILDHGESLSSSGLANYNNANYMEIKKTGYTADDSTAWICETGCISTNQVYSQSVAYTSSDFCDISEADCSVTLKVNWRVTKVNFVYNVNGGTITSQTTSSSGTVDNWTTDSDGNILLNNNLIFNTLKYGASNDLVNFNNSAYMYITLSGEYGKYQAVWECVSGCTTVGTTYSQTTTYSPSDFCNIDNYDCTVYLQMNWITKNWYTSSPSWYFDTLEHAAEVANEEASIKLLNTFTDSSSATIDKNLTINTNSKTVTRTGYTYISSGTLTVNGSGGMVQKNDSTCYELFKMTGGNLSLSSVTFTDTTTTDCTSSIIRNAGAGTLTVGSGTSITTKNPAVRIDSSGGADFTGGTITGTSDAEAYLIYVLSTSTATINLSGTTLTTNAADMITVYSPGTAEINMTDGTVSAAGYGILANDTFTMSGGTIETTSTSNAYYTLKLNADAVGTVTGGTIQSSCDGQVIYLLGTLTVNGTGVLLYNSSSTGGTGVSVYNGGIFYFAAGKIQTLNASALYVKNASAYINYNSASGKGSSYTTTKAAYIASKNYNAIYGSTSATIKLGNATYATNEYGPTVLTGGSNTYTFYCASDATDCNWRGGRIFHNTEGTAINSYVTPYTTSFTKTEYSSAQTWNGSVSDYGLTYTWRSDFGASS